MADTYRYPKCPHCDITMQPRSYLNLADKKTPPEYWWFCKECGAESEKRETFNESLVAAIGWEKRIKNT